MLSRILVLANRVYAVLNTARAPRKSFAAYSLRPDCMSALASSLSVAGDSDAAGSSAVSGAGRGCAVGAGCFAGAASALVVASIAMGRSQRARRIARHCLTAGDAVLWSAAIRSSDVFFAVSYTHLRAHETPEHL